MKRLLKTVVAAAMLACVTAAFFGCGTDLACRIQPAATVFFLVVLLLTPIIGRLFCECFCFVDGGEPGGSQRGPCESRIFHRKQRQITPEGSLF